MIPLRLRRRADGTVCLMAASGAVKGDGLEFPEGHLFLHDVLARESAVMRVAGDSLQLELANGTATYRVDQGETNPQGVYGVLVESETHDPPPVDEGKAAELAAQRATQPAAEEG